MADQQGGVAGTRPARAARRAARWPTRGRSPRRRGRRRSWRRRSRAVPGLLHPGRGRGQDHVQLVAGEDLAGGDRVPLAALRQGTAQVGLHGLPGGLGVAQHDQRLGCHAAHPRVRRPGRQARWIGSCPGRVTAPGALEGIRDATARLQSRHHHPGRGAADQCPRPADPRASDGEPRHGLHPGRAGAARALRPAAEPGDHHRGADAAHLRPVPALAVAAVEVHLPLPVARPQRGAVLPAAQRAPRGDAADHLHPDHR